eukprot:TRINITY_DN16108_c0_g1_i1.p1 TRINITY_DN16108_c0_g1~~TRINITY_DN16108_c0_g1_i1.p1  ORF type:complete len:327 (+),score=55.61 TRINITY_DN16108_c0_g1_i1:337-1317(+)
MGICRGAQVVVSAKAVYGLKYDSLMIGGPANALPWFGAESAAVSGFSEARGLPVGIALDRDTGAVTGVSHAVGVHRCTVRVHGRGFIEQIEFEVRVAALRVAELLYGTSAEAPAEADEGAAEIENPVRVAEGADHLIKAWGDSWVVSPAIVFEDNQVAARRGEEWEMRAPGEVASSGVFHEQGFQEQAPMVKGFRVSPEPVGGLRVLPNGVMEYTPTRCERCGANCLPQCCGRDCCVGLHSHSTEYEVTVSNQEGVEFSRNVIVEIGHPCQDKQRTDTWVTSFWGTVRDPGVCCIGMIPTGSCMLGFMQCLPVSYTHLTLPTKRIV